jgi:hypothetical protein
MKKNKFIVLFLFLFCAIIAKADDLNKSKMEKITKDILDVFINNKLDEKSDFLRKYISNEWLEKKRLDVKKFKINNYSPDTYDIIYSEGDVCLAVISGASWSHLLVFRFTEENANYRVVPRGISEASSDYIDPWYYVKDYLCSEKNEK